MPSIHIGFNIATILVILLVVVACGISFYFYRTTLPPVPPFKRRVLTALRSTGLSLVLILLFEPLLRMITTTAQPPTLAVLVDASKSMTIKDRIGDRAEILRALLQRPELRPSGNVALRYYTFGGKLGAATAEPPDSLPLVEEATDISSALKSLGDEKDGVNIRAALLLTDGSYNLGQNPVHEAERLGLPLFSIGIGDSSEQKDVLITKVSTNDLVYNETEVPVDITVKSSGFKGERVEVTLFEGTRELGRSLLVLGEGTREYPVRLSYVPEGEGTRRYTVRVSTLEGELTPDNNRKSFFARVLKSKLRILIVGGAPGPDVSILKQTLREENHIEVRALTQRSPSGFYEGPLTVALLDSSDCLMLVGFPTAATASQTLDLIRNAVLQRNLPLLFLDGKGVDYAKLGVLGPALPFTVITPAPTEQYVFFSPSTVQKNHPVLATGAADPAVWDRLPPLFSKQSAFRAKPEATVLGVVRIQNVVTTEPMILARSIGRQKSLAVMAYGLWRWRLMAQGNPDTEQLLSSFLSNAVRWLTTLEESKPVKVSTTRELYTRGEPVEFVGQVYDASALPVDNAQLRVTVQQEGQEFESLLRSIGNGRYEGTMDGLTEGDYTFRGSASLDGQTLGEDRGRFVVGELNLEFLDTRMNAQLLRQLAFRTGGKYFTPENPGELASALSSLSSFGEREVRDTTELELWNWQYTLSLIITLFAIEWFIRKRSGML